MTAPSSQVRASSLATAVGRTGGGAGSSGGGLESSSRRSSTPGQPGSGTTPATAATGPAVDLASSSAASSQMASASASGSPSRSDQIVYRFYLKTVGVLVDGRVTHIGGVQDKKDRWFNITIPDTDVHKGDLTIYRSISAYPPLPRAPPGEGTSRSTIPPLLIAFILDTNDIPAGQTLMWSRDGVRVSLDPCRGHAPTAGAKRPGIVLEQWTFRVTDVAASVPTGSEMAPPTAYRLGIIHFRALYAFIRLLPAYRLFRRLRRLNTGLRLGIKLWGPEGYATNTPAGLAEAWDIIERGLVGINVPLEHMTAEADTATTTESTIETYDFAPLDLFGNTYELGVAYRPNVDFEVEDMESVLSERFVDMDEEWFTPTVARHRLEEARAAASTATSRSVSRTANPTPASATPPRQPGSSLGASRQVASRTGTTPSQPSSLGAAKWGALAENLPFASASQMATENSSPTSTAIPYRRLSAHSLQPFRSISASPSTSVLRGGPVAAVGGLPSPIGAAGRNIPGVSGTASPLPGSLPRMSEFLSSSGRSFSHAQMANMAAASPPIMPGLGGSPPFAPSSLSFSKQAVRQQPTLAFSTTSPFVASSLDRDSPSVSPQSNPRRYSGSIGRRLPGSPASGDSPSSIRRTSTRESGLRHSIDEPRPDAPDKDDVHAFLRQLDSWTPPATIAPHSQSPRTTTTAVQPTPTAGPSLTTTAAAPRQSSATSSISPSPSITTGPRAPLTRQHVDDMLKRMVGSFSTQASPSGTSPAAMSRAGSNMATSSLASRRESMGSERTELHLVGTGLLSASRPSTSPRQLPLPGSLSASPRSAVSPLPGSSLRHGSLPRARSTLSPVEAEADAPAARSLPGAVPTGTTPPAAGGLRALSPLSPQTTGGTTDSRRRGPVLVRGGFNPPASSKGSTTSSSPSHSPVRDFVRPYRLGVSAERGREETLASGPSGGGAGASLGARRSASALTSGIGMPSSYTRRVGRTAPSSLGADVSEDSETEAATGSTRRGGRGVGRVASEGSTSPATIQEGTGSGSGTGMGGGMGSGVTRTVAAAGNGSGSGNGNGNGTSRSPVVESLMARLALAEQQARERREYEGYGP